VLFVVKDGLVASCPFGSEWDGLLEEWGDSKIFEGSVQAAFVERGQLHVVKDGLVAVENWPKQDWDGSLSNWGPMFPASMKTAFTAEGKLYIVRLRD